MSQSRSTGITRKQCSGCLSPQRESKIIFILDSTPWIPDSRNWIPLFVNKTWILDSGIVSGFLDSLCCIPNSTSKIFPDSGVYKQNFPRLQIPDSRRLSKFSYGAMSFCGLPQTKMICTETRRVSSKHDFSSYNIYKAQ